MKFSNIAIATSLALAGLSAPAIAQEVGATVFGPQGGEVGTIEQIEGGNVVINTGNLTATLPADVLGEGENGPVIGWNKADLEAAVTAANAEAEAQAKAALAAALVVGAPVVTADAQSLGTVHELLDGNVVVKAEDATLVTLPVDMFAVNADGAVMALANLADIEAALEAQAQGG